MNVSDSELVESVLIKEGYNAIDNPDIADVLFVNTCSIREHAEDKVHSLLGRYNLLKKNKPSMILAKKNKNFLLETPKKFTLGGKKNYYISHMYNCIFDFQYCYLQGMFNSANYVIFVNYESFVRYIEKKL